MQEFFPVTQVRPLTCSEVRAVDAFAAEHYGVPTLILMENAGLGASEWLLSRMTCVDGRPPRVLILCGPGNNGGDGGVVARHLDLRGVVVKLVGFTEVAAHKGDAAVQWSIIEKSGLDPIVLTSIETLDPLIAEADWVVDALFGTGLTRPLDGLYGDVLAVVNRSGKPVIALDIPSGLDADSGRPLGKAIKANATLTFVARKIGFDQPGAAEYLGEVVVIGIGAPRALLERYGTEEGSSE